MFGFGKKVQYRNFPDLNMRRRTDVVGESYYQENLALAASWKLPADQSLWVALRAEPSNQHDRQAIRVDWVKPDGSGWLTVGYIPRDQTKDWHPVVASAPAGSVWVWPAELIGGGKSKSWGIYLNG
jgi:hypothetical protein